MTLVEIFDKSVIKNFYSTVVLKPERLIYIYDSEAFGDKFNKVEIERFLKKYCPETKLAGFFEVSADSITSVIKVCEGLREKYNDLSFDLSGGRELMLFGALSFCNDNNIPCYYIDLRKMIFIGLVNCDNFPDFNFCSIGIDKLLHMSGVAIRRSMRKPVKFSDFETIDDLNKIISIAKSALGRWPAFAGYMQTVSKNRDFFDNDAQLRYTSALNLRNSGFSSSLDMGIFNRMVNEGLIIRHGGSDESEIDFEFKNDLVKRICKDKGAWLEYYTLLCAYKTKLFDELMISAVIDWIEEKGEESDPVNEIDVILMKGITPIFISCKTGVLEPSHLFEIKYLSERFGGNNAKAVIVTSTAVNNPSLIKRMSEMDIACIDKGSIEQKDFCERLKGLVK